MLPAINACCERSSHENEQSRLERNCLGHCHLHLKIISSWVYKMLFFYFLLPARDTVWPDYIKNLIKIFSLMINTQSHCVRRGVGGEDLNLKSRVGIIHYVYMCV